MNHRQTHAAQRLSALAVFCTAAVLAGCNHAVPAAGTVDMAVWALPGNTLQARIQVRLATQTTIHDATLSAESPARGIVLTPPSFTVPTLSPPRYPDKEQHNPPALGKTLLRTFTARVMRPGAYPVRISLRWAGHRVTRSLTLHIPGPRVP